MTQSSSARAAARHFPAVVFAAAVVLNAVLIVVLTHQSRAPVAAAAHRSWIETAPKDRPTSKISVLDGAVPDGVTVFDDETPAVVNLNADLLAVLRRAATDATDDGIAFVVNSGWRSPNYQDHLLREAVSEYGSDAEAARWVATPDTSAHVSGDAVDIGPADAAAWLSRYGVGYGLCQIYRNEPWHYELLPDSVDRGCPPAYADPTQDPRMQQ